MAGSVMNKGDVRFLTKEILDCDRAIKAGNRDRYILGRRNAFAGAAERLWRIDRDAINRYMDYVHDEVVREGKSMTSLEEPFSWVRKNQA